MFVDKYLFFSFFCRDTTELDVAAVYHQLVDTYHSSESDIDVEENSEKPSTSRLRSSSSKRLRSQTFAQDWKTACRQLLETLWQCEDSIPFRYDYFHFL